jgi:hypothetical protein
MNTFVKQEQTVMIKTGNWMKRQIICFEKNKKWLKLCIATLFGRYCAENLFIIN